MVLESKVHVLAYLLFLRKCIIEKTYSYLTLIEIGMPIIPMGADKAW